MATKCQSYIYQRDEDMNVATIGIRNITKNVKFDTRAMPVVQSLSVRGLLDDCSNSLRRNLKRLES